MTSLAAPSGRLSSSSSRSAGSSSTSGASASAAPSHNVLTFADLPSDLAQLRALDSASATANNKISNAHANPNPQPHPQPRKPSPGLAARLKALGFGPSRKTSPPPPPPHLLEPVGRLPEDQLRQLDQKHQAGSAAPIIERRGRPWKGAIARIPSVTGSRGRDKGDDDSPAPPASDFLPEIQAEPPLEMDTNKYRLPDHTNGNGTKVQLDTRQQHLERDTRPPASPAPSSPEVPPPPLRKDTPPPGAPAPAQPIPSVNEYTPDAVSYFNPLGLQRPGSIYTLSRASFANQLAQLTSIQLPDAESLSSKVSAIPTAQAAARALIGAADQIRNWISKASEVIGGLDSDDDVEWAAAGGREGLEEVENAIMRFEELINVYVSAIEELQCRSDIGSVSPEDLNRAVIQMESILDEWAKMRITLNSVKGQVEIAMEWEELWNMVLGDIQNEMDELSRLVFEMEERRHKSILAAASGGGDGLDIGDLETIVEETPPNAARLQPNHRFSLPAFPVSPSSPSVPTISQDDSSLLALFARMQPLRASLDFLPMRLSVFEARAERCFPTACEELEMRRADLDGSYKKLENDAESLRKELGEDRWVVVFRGAGRQAQKMYESVERSVGKVKEAVDAGMHLTNQPMMGKKIEGYETKKTHYGPAIERVLSIIDKGVKDRLTVNGEILRLHAEMQTKWDELKDRMREMDLILEELQSDNAGQQLRDSISSMLSNDRSTIGSGHETPQSSPPSSVIMSSLGLDTTTPTNRIKRRSSSIGSHLPQPVTRRSVSASSATTAPPRKPVQRYSTTTGALPTPSREGSVTPVGGRALLRQASSTVPNRPRWNSSTTGVDTGHNFKPLSLTSPSPYAKSPVERPAASVTPKSGLSKLPMLRSPLGRAGSASPIPEDTPSKPASNNRLSFRERLTSPGPYLQQTLSSKPRLASQSSMSALNIRRASLQPAKANENTTAGTTRPASSLASTRRTSMLPTLRPRQDSGGAPSGRNSPQVATATLGSGFGMRRKSNASDQKPLDNKPRWRG